jgi:flagellin-like protein
MEIYNNSLYQLRIYLLQEIELNLDVMKGLSPIIATVMLIALSLSVVAILATWFSSLTKSQTENIESGSVKLVNCTTANLDLVGVICSNLGQIDLYDFSTLAQINNTYYQNSTGGPNSTHPLSPGHQTILIYGCDLCTTNAKVSVVRVTPGNCPQIYEEKNVEVNCG